MTDGVKREQVNERNRQQRTSVRDIGEIPAVVNWRRRMDHEFSLERFLRTYLRDSFSISFSTAHQRNLSRIQDIVLKSGQYIQAIPRGFGKSTMAEGAGLWALLYGHRKFFPIITAGDDAAEKRMLSIKTMLEYSDLLLEDFPEVCFPIRALNGIAQRAKGQLYKGGLTNIEWSADTVVLPSIPELDPERRQCRACGSILTACGITSSRIRGLNHLRVDGVRLRPDLVFIDDPQTDESARNPAQVEKRRRIIESAILGMAGHKKTMSVIVACNIIARDDLIEQLLSPDTPNGFEGERVSLIEKFPDELDGLWEAFRAKLMAYDKEKPGDAERAHREAAAFYLENREAMDAGALLAWPDAFDERSESGIHYAMTKYYKTPPESFASEYQNQPLADSKDEGQLTPETVAAKILPGQPRGVVPARAERLTAFVDVQGKCLFWLVAAWSGDFTGHVVDYGAFPDQKRRYFTMRDLPGTLARMFPGRGQEALWRAGLDALTGELLTREYERDDGAVMKIERLLVDANDGNAREVVFEFCRQSRHPTVVMPYTSKGVRAGDRPFDEYVKKPGDVKGLNWRMPAVNGRREVRRMLADVNFWKSFIRTRWLTAVGDPGALTLFTGDGETHRLFLEHMTSEYSIRTEGRGRAVDEWRQRPNMPENHWWDCLVGAAVAASFAGCKLPEAGNGEVPEKRRWRTLKEARALRGAGTGARA